ncbi:MAG TPA: diguanylate cyclase [Solirubrobacteraceae bacterium]|nr:diguanylate cyclase [Solirubrobacteraceae bacterium]
MLSPPRMYGMVARELRDTARPPRGSIEFLSEGALRERLEEEVNRAARHGTALSCLLLDLADLPALRHAHGELLVERVLAYVELALRRELRRFDRVGRPSEGELLVVLPGADLPRGELVARRMLLRLRSLKLESSGRRRSLGVAVGLAPWRAGMSAGALLGAARVAAGLERSENGRLPG